MIDYAVDLARATRSKEPGSPEFMLARGAGPRASQSRILTARARAVAAAHIRTMTRPVLRHHLFTNFNADAAGVDAPASVDRLLKEIPESSYGEPAGDGTRWRR